MNIPRTTKLTLKRIVEAVQDGSLPDNGFGEKPAPMPSDKKKKLMELAAMYENFGECLKNEESLMNSAKGITELCELAESYALNECGEWFQKEIVTKDMQGLKKRVSEFQKIVKETYARMQQAGVAYQDIGHVLGRYYDLKGTHGSDQQYQEKPGPQPLQETESDETTQKGGKMADAMLAKGTKKKVTTEGMDADVASQRKAEIGEKPTLSVLSPEETKQTLLQFGLLLPASRQKIVAALRNSCSWCEGQFKLPPLAISHGICSRHFTEMMGRPPSVKASMPPDLSTYQPEELQMAAKVSAIRHQKKDPETEIYDEDKDRPWVKDINRPWLPNG